MLDLDILKKLKIIELKDKKEIDLFNLKYIVLFINESHLDIRAFLPYEEFGSYNIYQENVLTNNFVKTIEKHYKVNWDITYVLIDGLDLTNTNKSSFSNNIIRLKKLNLLNDTNNY